MTKKEVNPDRSLLIGKDNSLLEIVNTESDSINESLNIIDALKKKHNIDLKQISELLKHRERYVAIPVGLFRSKLGPLEAVVRYLRDVLEYNFAQTARLLSRDETTIWTSYHNSLKKSKKVVVDLEMSDIDFKGMKVKKEDLVIPLNIFAERRLSILESLCVYLKESFKLSYRNMGVLLERNERTVWTVVSRAGKKLKE